jgi:hypothetical protein
LMTKEENWQPRRKGPSLSTAGNDARNITSYRSILSDVQQTLASSEGISRRTIIDRLLHRHLPDLDDRERTDFRNRILELKGFRAAYVAERIVGRLTDRTLADVRRLPKK